MAMAARLSVPLPYIVLIKLEQLMGEDDNFDHTKVNKNSR